MEFVGAKVHLIIAPSGDEKNLVKIKGIVAHVEPGTQRLTLKQGISNVKMLIFQAKLVENGQERSLGAEMVQILASDIRELKLGEIEEISTSSPVVSTVEPLKKSKKPQSKPLQPPNHHVAPTHAPTPVESAEEYDFNQMEHGQPLEPPQVTKKDRRKTPRKQRVDKYLGVPSTWTKTPVTSIIEAGDFDFEASAAEFDKKAVFEEIRRADQTKPEDRLVAFNKNDPQRKLHHREMVLDPEEQAHVSLSSDGNDSDDELSTVDVVPKSPKVKPPPPSVKEIKPNPATLREALVVANDARANKVCRTITGVSVPAVTWRAWERLLEKNDPKLVTGVAVVEHAARSLVTFALQAVTSSKSASTKSKPQVAILAGCDVRGSMAISAARILSAHDVQVYLVVIDPEEQIKQQLLSVDVDTRYDVVGLNRDVDLIIDALIPPSLAATTLPKSFLELNKNQNQALEWIKSTKAPKCSVDVPSGWCPDSGRQFCKEPVKPRWVLCMGLPKAGILCMEQPLRLYLGFSGLTPVTVGSLFPGAESRWKNPFGDKFLVSCEVSSRS